MNFLMTVSVAVLNQTLMNVVLATVINCVTTHQAATAVHVSPVSH